jgi:iron complex outermembrane receptor protein
MRLFYFTFFILFFIGNGVFAQTGDLPATGSVSGILVDTKNVPVSYATVTLLRMDSSVVNGDLSKDDGSFRIFPTGLGGFLLRIESIGMITKFLSVQVTSDAQAKNLGSIKLGATENKLREVEVVGEKSVMELKVDKKVFNVEKNTTTAGGSASDVLQNVPSVSVAADGTISLRGKSDVTILIDGKPATMLGSDVTSALQSLPAGSIESVEVITNPSAKYDAQGTSGIINIITKKDGRFGMNGNLTLGAGTNDKYNGNLGLNARKGKWNVFLNSSIRYNSTFNDVITDRVDKSETNNKYQSYHTFEHVPRHFDGAFNTIGASFDPDKYNSITVTENINRMGFGYKDFSDYFIYGTPDENPANSFFNRNRNTDFAVRLLSVSSAVDYKHKFKKKDEELNLDATYSTTDIHRKQDFITRITDSTGISHATETAPATGNNSSFNAWADYTDPLFTKNGKLGLGFKSQITWFTSNSSNPLIYDSTHSDGKLDSSLLAIFHYQQQIHAAYINWSDQLGKFSYQAGLRVEDAIYDGNGKLPFDTTFHNSFFDFFPSAFISYQLPKQQSVYLNYSRRTNRPGFMQLLPFKDFSNPGTVNMGNPALIPEFINNLEFSYNKSDNKGNNFILSAYYAVTQNLTQRVTRRITEADSTLGLKDYVGSLLTQPLNITSGTTYGLEGTGHFQLMPIWDATLNVNFFQNQLNVGQVDTAYRSYLTNNNGASWFGKLNTSIKLPMNFSFQVNANYESPRVIAQGKLKETYWVDLALRKNLWKNKATLIINCSDVFKTHNNVTYYDLPIYSQTINRIRETRIGNITFTYRFGKSDMGKAGANAGGKRGKGMDDKNKPVKPNSEDRDKNLKDKDDDQGGSPGGGGGQGGGKGSGTAN